MPIKEVPMMEFSEALNSFGRKLTRTDGRARRSEFWWVELCAIVIGVVLTPLGSIVVSILMIPLTIRRLHDTGRSAGWLWWNIVLKGVFMVMIFGTIISMCIQALSGSGDNEMGNVVAFLLQYVAFIGVISLYDIVLVIFLCLDSEEGPNQYGASPKYVVEDDPYSSAEEGEQL